MFSMGHDSKPCNAFYLTAALRKFVDLPDFEALQAPMQAFCEAHDVRGGYFHVMAGSASF